MNINPTFSTILQPYIKLIDDLVWSTFMQDCVNDRVGTFFDHLFSAKGKRVRSILCLLSSSYTMDADGEWQIPHSFIQLGAVLEMVHLASLIHDDIVDQSQLRHHKLSLHEEFNISNSVLMGDLIYAKALQILSSLKDSFIVSEISCVIEMMCLGEITQYYRRHSIESMTMADYLDVIRQKTASLIAVSMKLGAYYPQNLSLDTVQKYSDIGYSIGILYQLQDDMLDVFQISAVLGKSAFNDFFSGEITLPILLLLQHLDQEEKEKFYTFFKHSEDREQVKIYLKFLLDKYDTYNEVNTYISKNCQKILQSIEDLNCVHKDYLIQLIDLVRTRVY